MGKVIVGDCREVMRTMPDASVDCCVTSPPYWGLRDYGHDGQIGLEETPEAYVARMVEVFREVRRVLKDDGTLWLNLGDSYATVGTRQTGRNDGDSNYRLRTGGYGEHAYADKQKRSRVKTQSNLRPKELVGVPWRVAFALQADGWWLRQDIIWHKPNPMPESVRDRCTKAHEYVFLLAKSQRYYFDSGAAKEPAVTDIGNSKIRFGGAKYGDSDSPKHSTKSGNAYIPSGTRNKRSVWSITTKPFKGEHFATMPLELAELCVVIGCPAGGVVLDPFFGAGTTGLAAVRNGRDYIGAELNQQYAAIAESRIAEYAPLFTRKDRNG